MAVEDEEQMAWNYLDLQLDIFALHSFKPMSPQALFNLFYYCQFLKRDKQHSDQHPYGKRNVMTEQEKRTRDAAVVRRILGREQLLHSNTQFCVAY